MGCRGEQKRNMNYHSETRSQSVSLTDVNREIPSNTGAYWSIPIPTDAGPMCPFSTISFVLCLLEKPLDTTEVGPMWLTRRPTSY